MIIHKTPSIKQAITSLLATKSNNIEVAFLLQNFWKLSQDLPPLQTKDMNAHGYAKMMINTLKQFANITVNPSYIVDYLLPGIQEITMKTYEQNPFFKAIKPSPSHLGKWQLKYEHYSPYQAFPLQDVTVLDTHDFREITPIGYTRKKSAYLTIQEAETVWMSVTPFEIESMQPVIHALQGRVLTLGLGLGYFAFMASLKPSVEHVTIIEKDAHVIALFKTHILPQFPHIDKITILHQDAYEAMIHLPNKESYDHIFVDIYHDASDGLESMLTLKPYEILYPNASVHYWLETSILCLFRRYVLSLIEEQMGDTSLIDYTKGQSFDDKVINHVYAQTKHMMIKSPEDLHHLLTTKGLKALLLKTFIDS